MPTHTLQQPTDDEIAAALAAVQMLLAAEQEAAHIAPPRGAWRATSLLEVQQLPSTRNSAFARWPATARARRAEGWSEGLL